MQCAAILLLGGRGLRAGTLRPKQFELIHGLPVFSYALYQLVQTDLFSCIACVVEPEDFSLIQRLFSGMKSQAQLLRANPGDRRHLSVLSGLESLPQEIEIVAIHDGARPNPGVGLIQKLISGVREDGHARIPGLPLVDTVKKVNSAGKVRETIERSHYMSVQTPQVARREALLKSFGRLPVGQVPTDDAQVLEFAGYEVHIERGHSSNLKITWPEDFERAGKLLEPWK